MTDDIKQQRVPWICKECWEYLRDDEPGDTCRHCKAIANWRAKVPARLIAGKLLIGILWLTMIGNAVSVLCDIFFWGP